MQRTGTNLRELITLIALCGATACGQKSGSGTDTGAQQGQDAGTMDATAASDSGALDEGVQGDASPGDTGTIQDAGPSDSGLPPSCSALSFNGLSTMVSVPDNANLTLGNSDFTIEFYLWLAQLGNYQLVGHDTGNGLQNKWVTYFDGAHLALQVAGSGFANAPILFNYSWSPTTNTWYHVAITRTGSTYHLFIDGTLVSMDSLTGAIPDPSAPLTFGWWEGPSNYLNGRLAQVRISSIVRYPANFTRPIALASDANTIGLWHLTEGSGATAVDSSSNMFNGSITAGTWSNGTIPFECRPLTCVSGNQTFSTVGSMLFTVPVACMTLDVSVWGSGGGGGSGCVGCGYAGAGGGGGYSTGTFSVTPGDSYTVTIGSGGTAGSTGGHDGVQGSITSFGALISATGGAGGHAANNGRAGGSGGTGSGGTTNLTGGMGATGTQTTWGNGGDCAGPNGGQGGGNPSESGRAATAPGGGGGPSGGSGQVPGSGMPGQVTVSWH